MRRICWGANEYDESDAVAYFSLLLSEQDRTSYIYENKIGINVP
jgi:hypothetical protein